MRNSAARAARPGFAREQALWAAGIARVAGVDEAGRGPLAGPVVAAAVVFLEPSAPEGLDDSKRLAVGVRERLYAELTSHPAVLWAVAWREAGVIDRVNILRATHEAMAEALAGLAGVGHALVDGLPAPGLPVPHAALVGGDRLSCSIAAASVIAKVSRDRAMRELDGLYPQYGFATHKGYATRDHLARLRKHGPCPIHRRSFAPVAQAELFRDPASRPRQEG